MFACYRGTSFVSRVIEWRTWSPYSHVSWITEDGLDMEYESWPTGGVTYLPFGKNHTAGTIVDLYTFIIPLKTQERDALESFYKSQVGKKYDWSGIGGFLWIGRTFGLHHERNRWFCSELASEGCIKIARPINHKPSYKVPPDDFSTSAILKYVGSRIVPQKQTLALA